MYAIFLSRWWLSGLRPEIYCSAGIRLCKRLVSLLLSRATTRLQVKQPQVRSLPLINWNSSPMQQGKQALKAVRDITEDLALNVGPWYHQTSPRRMQAQDPLCPLHKHYLQLRLPRQQHNIGMCSKVSQGEAKLKKLWLSVAVQAQIYQWNQYYNPLRQASCKAEVRGVWQELLETMQ